MGAGGGGRMRTLLPGWCSGVTGDLWWGVGGGGRRRGKLEDHKYFLRGPGLSAPLTSLIPGVSNEGCPSELIASKLLQDNVEKVGGGVPGRPSPCADTVFQSLGFRCRRPS